MYTAARIAGNGRSCIRFHVEHIPECSYYRLFYRPALQSEAQRIQVLRDSGFTLDAEIESEDSYTVNVAYSPTGADGSWTFMGAKELARGGNMYHGQGWKQCRLWVYQDGAWHMASVWVCDRGVWYETIG